jgi:DNA-binding response OmpR family regulator
MRYLILYAEDEKQVADFYIEDFVKNGFDVIWAKNGRDALELYKKHVPDIVLLDIKMPGMDGYEVAKTIRKKDSQTPIMYLTSSQDSNSATNGFNLGADDHVRKNTEFKEIIARTRRLIERHPARRKRIFYLTKDTCFDANANILTSCGHSEQIS